MEIQKAYRLLDEETKNQFKSDGVTHNILSTISD